MSKVDANVCKIVM